MQEVGALMTGPLIACKIPLPLLLVSLPCMHSRRFENIGQFVEGNALSKKLCVSLFRMIDAGCHRHLGVVDIDAVNGVAKTDHFDILLVVEFDPVVVGSDFANLLKDAVLEAHF